MMLCAQFSDMRQSLFIPDLTYRIVRIAQNHERSLRIGKLLLQICIINMIFMIFIYKWAFQYITSVIQNRIIERIVYRRHDQHIFSRCSQLTYRAGDCRDNTCTEHDPVILYLYVMSISPPVDIGIVPFLRNICIAIHSMLQPLSHGIHDLRCSLEIHISHPHGQFSWLYLPFNGISAPSVYNTVKIILHVYFLLLRTYASPCQSR